MEDGIVTIDRFGVMVSPRNCMKGTDVPREVLIRKAIKRLQAELDKHENSSIFISADEYRELERSFFFKDEDDVVCYSEFDYLYTS